MLRAIVLLLFAVPALAAPTLSGKVVGITDGDTLTLLVERRQVKVRLAEIDAPEKGQAFGKRATQALARLTFRKDALVVVVDYDRYGRTGVCLGVSEISSGYQDVRIGNGSPPSGHGITGGCAPCTALGVAAGNQDRLAG